MSLQNHSSNTENAIAIIGMNCCFPGGANDYHQFWQLLLDGYDAISEIPQDRWDLRKFYHQDPSKAAKAYIKAAGFLNRPLDEFDPLFFGISPREAESLDPQQRLLLEVCWQAFEDAGIALQSLRGSDTAVFIGGFCLDNQLMQLGDLGRELIDSHTATSSTMTMLASRLSYVFDLKGPCMTIDTACSSSLMALHYACQSIINGEATMAIAGGVNAIFKPENAIVMSKGQFLSPDAKCMTFSKHANGYVRGEGAGTVILKSLAQAVIDGDRIHAIIAATGANQDGQTLGVTLPNGEAQQSLMQQVYQKAKVNIDDIGYIEAHGTGTQAGDVTEANSINAVFKNAKTAPVVGSVKTNIGHLEAAAGVAGLIKAVLCLKHKTIPANLHFVDPNPNIAFDKIKVPTKTLAWEQQGSYFAAINSFGYGGSNAHALLQAFDKESSQSEAKESPANHAMPLAFSAPTEARLEQLLSSIHAWLAENPSTNIHDLAYSLNQKKTHFSHRLVAWVNSTKQLTEKLSQHIAQDCPNLVSQGKAFSNEAVFVCTGMGPQWPLMGEQLYKTEAVYKMTVTACDDAFQKITGRSILDELFKPEHSSKMHQPQIAQVANFILQVSLARLLASMGIKPTAILGHSVGEIAAFHISGALSLNDGICISYHRARLQNTLYGQGEMLAANLSVSAAKAEIAGSSINIAAINSPNSLTLSGNKEDIEALAVSLDKKQIFNRLLGVNLPYHSSIMENIKDAFLTAIESVRLTKASIPIYSTVSGELIDPTRIGSHYWWKNAREAVDFNQTINTVLDDGFNTFIEVGPHPVLKHYINEIATEHESTIKHFATLNRRAENEREQLFESMGEMHCHGLNLNFNAWKNSCASFIDTPYQVWMKESYWRESIEAKVDRLGSTNNPWFYQQLTTVDSCWQVELNQSFFPYMQGHQIFDMVVLPAASTIEAAISTIHQSTGSISAEINNLHFEAMPIINDDETQTLTIQHQKNTHRFSLHCSNKTHSIRHASADIYPMPLSRKAKSIAIESLKDSMQNAVTIADLYRQFDHMGLGYRGDFQSIRQLYVKDNCVLAALQCTSAYTHELSPLHPALLDGAFQSLIAMHLDAKCAYLPYRINTVRFYKQIPSNCWSYASDISIDDDGMQGNISIYDALGDLCLQVLGLHLKAMPKKHQLTEENNYYQLQWQPQEKNFDDAKIQMPLMYINQSGNSAILENLNQRLPSLIELELNNDRLMITNSDHSQQGQALDSQLMADLQLERMVYITQPSNTLSSLDVREQSWSLIAIAKALAAIITRPFQLSVLTWQAQNVENDIEDISSYGLANLARVIENENSLLSIHCIDSDQQTSVKLLADEIITGQAIDTIAYRKNTPYCHNLVQTELLKDKKQIISLNSTDVTLTVEKPGVIDSLSFVSRAEKALAKNEVKIKVHASALNFKDILKITNKLDPIISDGTFFGTSLGMEISGIVVDVGSAVKKVKCGQQVIAPLRDNFSSFAYIAEDYVLPKPSTLDFNQAPVLTVFLAAYRGLIQIANIQPGEKVLIHSATGGVGLAAIQIARHSQAEIYATAGSVEKRQYLADMGIDHIYDSHSDDFKQQILEDTNNYGVDVVLNSTAGTTLIHSFNLLAAYGRFIEIGKKDIAENSLLPMQAFNRNISFSAIDIDRMLVDRMDIITPLSNTVLGLFERKILTPLPSTVFKASETVEAFKFMAQSKHIGKVILDYKDVELSAKIPQPKYAITNDACYIITGGTSGFGYEVAQLLLQMGAQKVYLLSRRGKLKPEQCDPRLEPRAIDISDKEALASVFNEIEVGPLPLKGIIHSAMVLDDKLISSLDKDAFDTVLQPKVAGAVNLHQLSLNMALDFFIQFSSISALIGNIGQASYVTANSFLDALCHYRMRQQLVCTSINWGVLNQVGVVASNDDLSSLLANAGIKGFDNHTALGIVQQLLRAPSQHIGAFDIDWQQWVKQHPAMAKKSLYGYLIDSSADMTSQDRSQHAKMLALEVKNRVEPIAKIIRQTLAKTLKTRINQISLDEDINHYGIDSIVAIELVNSLRQQLQVAISPTDFMDGKSIVQLAESLSQRF